MGRRLQRLNTQVQRELSDLIRTELRDPRLGTIVSITRVDISPDLEKATVYVSILGEPSSKQETILALTSAAPFLRRHLLTRMRIKRAPALRFVLDETIEQAAHVLDLLKRVPGPDRD